jgi:DNA-binding Xre family transcriptional regulator
MNGGITMQLSIAIRHRLNKLLKERKLTPFALSMSAGVTPSTLNLFLSGHTKMLKMDTLFHYCEALELELHEFFNDSLFKNIKCE